MRSFNFFFTLLLTLFASLATARIVGVAVPDVIKPGEGFNAIIMVENYIQSVYDVSIAFGAIPRAIPPGTLGTVLNSYYLGPEQSNKVQNFTKWVPVPNNLPMGEARIAASLHSLYGAGSLPVLSLYNVNVTIGTYTSNRYVSNLNN